MAAGFPEEKIDCFVQDKNFLEVINQQAISIPKVNPGFDAHEHLQPRNLKGFRLTRPDQGSELKS